MEIGDAVGIVEKANAGVPQDARFVISVLNGDRGPAHERRRFRREPFVAPAELEVLGDAAPPRCSVYTRDANRWGVGFVTQHVLPVGRDATLRMWISAEQMLMVRSCVLRCREVLPGWFEGAVLFYEEEPRLETPPAGKEHSTP